MRKRGLFVFVVLAAAAAVLTASAGATSHGSAKIDLSTRGGVAVYLASQGVSLTGVVIQRGAHNYAGPSCPGKGWTCTTSKRVVQIAGDDGHGNGQGDDNEDNDDNGNGRGNGHNSFVCTGGSSSGPGQCQIFQFANGGASNNARCIEQSGDPNTDQSCKITQSSSTGSNSTLILQQVDTNDGSTQFAHQYGGVRQTSSTGQNAIQIEQDLDQSSNTTDASGLQKQNGHQEASISQSSSTGANGVQINQSLDLQAFAKGSPAASINQQQNADGTVNSNAAVEQFSVSGSNNAQVGQRNHYDAHINRALNGNQQQGASGVSGEAVSFTQNSSGLSTINARQHEHQTLEADRVTNLTQSQFGPQWADPSQGTNPNDTYNITQHSHQNASNPTTQEDEQFAECFTSGHCTVSEKIHQGNVKQTNSCSGSSCDVGNHVFTNGDGTSQGACPTPNQEEGGCQTEDQPPPPPLPPGD